jgi:phasin family protein
MTTTKKTSAAKDIRKTLEAAPPAETSNVEAVAKAGPEATVQQYQQAVAITQTQVQTQVEKASTMMFKGYDELNQLNKANLDAVVASTTTFAKGFEAISRELMSFAQGSIEANVSKSKKMFGVKSLQDLFELQSDLARSNFDTLMSQSAKLTELSVQVTNEAFEPLQARAQASVEQLLKPVAA